MSQTRKVVEALMKYGPRYSAISRETEVPITTVRYILREKLPKLGFTIRPAINHGKLGLRWYLVMLEFSVRPDYLTTMLDLFGESMYLSYYAYLLNERKFLTLFATSPKFEESFSNFLDELVKLNIVKRYVLKRLQYRRVVPFRADCFNFNDGVWIQNWDEISRSEDVPEILEEPTQIHGLSSLDIRILAEIYKNPFTSYSEIARRLSVSRQTIKKHYQNIVSKIYLYMLFWMPTRFPELVSTPMFVQTHFNSYTRKTILDIPFTHLEMKSDDSEYYSILFVPSVGFYKVLRYIDERGISGKIDFLSMEYAANFVPHYNLYDNRRGWINVFEYGLQKILKEVKLTG
ncbi:MAG: winged helix-turn-helix domain-containing protein [Nitrososphaerota archaeon]